MPTQPSRRGFLGAAAGTLVLSSCSLLSREASSPPTGDSTPRVQTPTPLPWPDPDPGRPQVALSLRIADDLASASGTEVVTFTPDQDVCAAEFRLWPNTTTAGTKRRALRITRATIGGEAATVTEPVATDPTRVQVALPECVSAGTTLRIELAFTVEVAADEDERLSRTASPRLSWFATAFPLLAWQRGVGWVTDRPTAIGGESVTSETFDLRSLRIQVPRGVGVAGVGTPTGIEIEETSATHTFKAPAVRDIVFVVGDLDTAQLTTAGTTVHLSLPAQTLASRQGWEKAVARSIDLVSTYLGPVPYAQVWITVVPRISSGLEMPGAVLIGDVDPQEEQWLLTHEVVHLWFYGLVGNNQAKHPWLDESLATFVQQQVDGSSSGRVPSSVRGHVGESLSFWNSYRRPSSAYVDGVYLAGAQALHDARAAAGAADFDKALRTYARDNAHRIADPSDFERAFASAPEALDVLRAAGAFSST